MKMLSSSSNRIGFGSMQLTGPGHWAAPDNPEQAMQVLRDAVDAGVTHIDTADAYGPFTGFLRGCPGLQAGEESDSCGAGQGTGFRPQGERPPTRPGMLTAVRCENQARTPC
jgi:Aldo/keto reductase family